MAALPSSSDQMRVQSPPPRWRHLPPLLSVMLHAVPALWLLGFPWPQSLPDKPAEPAAISVDIVPPPEPPAAPQPPPSQNRPPQPQGRAIPQLEEGELASRSTPVPPERSTAPAKPQVLAQPQARTEKKPAPVTQNERDWVLARVLRHWRAPSGLAAYEKADIALKVRVLPDGHFSDIYDSRRPWAPEQVFEGYGQLAPQAIQRRIIDAIYGAIRKAQPLPLPQVLRDKAPFDLRLDFRFKDAR